MQTQHTFSPQIPEAEVLKLQAPMIDVLDPSEETTGIEVANGRYVQPQR